MRQGGRILVLLGIVLGILSAGGAFIILSTAQPQTTQVPTRPVIIAQQNIPERTEIPLEALGKADWPEAFIPPGAYAKSELLAGMLTIQPIYQGQIILPQMVLDKNLVKETRSNASFLVPEGKVAVSFPNSALVGVSGALQTGDFVDILLTLQPSTLAGSTRVVTSTTTIGAEGQPITQVMLQDVLILQMGAWAPPGGGGDKAATADMITFALDRQDALALKSAREQGQIELALRRAGDHKVFVTEPVSLQYLNKRFNFSLAPAGR